MLASMQPFIPALRLAEFRAARIVREGRELLGLTQAQPRSMPVSRVTRFSGSRRDTEVHRYMPSKQYCTPSMCLA